MAVADTASSEQTHHTTLLLRDLHVTYRVHEDRRPRMRDVLSSGMKRPAFREIHAVRGVNLAAYAGQSIGIIGHNGSGKSTLLQAMAGLLPATSGQVWAAAQPSLLGVSAALRPASSGRRNIMLGCLALGMTREEVLERVDDIIEFTGLRDFIDLPIHTYSSGMRARLHFAIATAVEPDILLIDEALSVGDEQFKRRSQQRIAQMQQRAGTVIIVSHSLGTVRDLCDRAVWFHKGQVRDDGDAQDVVAAYRRHQKAATDGDDHRPGAAS